MRPYAAVRLGVFEPSVRDGDRRRKPLPGTVANREEMQPSIDAVCFDLDGTLLEYNQDGDVILEKSFDRADVAAFCDIGELWNCADDVPDAEDDHHFLTQTFEIAAGRHGGPSAAAERLARAYEATIDHTAVSFREGAERALEYARAHGPVGLVTNGERATQSVKLEALGIHGCFETHVYAGEMTPPKPAPEPFDRAVAELGTDPGRTLYVGNSFEADIVGAREAGLRAAWFPEDGARDGRDAPEYVFESLDELEAVL